jgi:hypothetical protein
MIRKLTFFGLLFLTATVVAQQPVDTNRHSPARTLTYEQAQAYLKGEAAEDMAMVAEMNHYPMPDKVLKWKKELDLSPIQVKKIADINSHMHARRLQTGQSIVNNEKTLDNLFSKGRVEEGDVIFFGNRYGAYLGELRNAMLMACVATEKELTPQQIAHFEALQKAN